MDNSKNMDFEEFVDRDRIRQRISMDLWLRDFLEGCEGMEREKLEVGERISVLMNRWAAIEF